jgi:nicotinate-nucleotide adenylyltransferase
MEDQTDLDEIWFVVSPQNPFKKRKSLLHEFDRIRMVELAIGDHFKFRASDIEFHMPKPSYTIDTLAFLSDKHPHHEFKLVIGGDNLKRFHKWKNSNVILDLYGLYVYPRPRETHPIDHENVLYIPSPLIDLSATFIRNAIKNGHSVKYLLPPLVEDFIRDKKFFLD